MFYCFLNTILLSYYIVLKHLEVYTWSHNTVSSLKRDDKLFPVWLGLEDLYKAMTCLDFEVYSKVTYIYI